MALDLFRVAGGLQIGDSSQVLEGASAPLLDAPVGSIYTETTTGGLYTKVAAGTGADKWELLAKNSYVNQQVADLTAMITGVGSVFNYVGVLTGGVDAGTATDLTLLPADQKNAGDYFKVTTSGYFFDGTNTFFANDGDGLVWNNSGTIDKIDNTNSLVQAGSNISVTGTADTGFTVNVSTAFANRVTTAENNITLLDGRVTTVEGNLTSVTARVTTAELDIDNLQAGLAQELIDRAAADSALNTAITNEVTRATGVENNIQTELDVTQAGAGLSTTGAYAPNGLANYISNATSLKDADNKLDAAIKVNADAIAAEVTRATTAENTLNTAITNEVTRATTAEGLLDGRLDIVESSVTVLQTNSTTIVQTGVTSSTDSVTAPMAKWLVWVQDATTTTNVTAYEIFAASNGVAVDFNRFGILKLGAGVTGAAVNVSQSGGNIVLTVTTSGSANITIKRVAVAA